MFIRNAYTYIQVSTKIDNRTPHYKDQTANDE